MKKYIISLSLILLAACNTVNIKPHSLDKSQVIYADRGGYTMKFAIKKELEDRGYKIVVGKAISTKKSSGTETFEDIELDSIDLMNSRYIIRAKESSETFSPVVCLFGGLYWWRFNVSIADQKTGEELLAWTGRGCANGALRRLNRLMSELEQQ